MHSIHNTKWELRQIKKERRVHVQPDYLSRWYYKSSNIAVAYSCLLLYLFIDIENFYNYIYDFLFINLQIIPQVEPQIKYFITDLSKMEIEKLCVFVGHNRKTSNYKKKPNSFQESDATENIIILMTENCSHTHFMQNSIVCNFCMDANRVRKLVEKIWPQ